METAATFLVAFGLLMFNLITVLVISKKIEALSRVAAMELGMDEIEIVVEYRRLQYRISMKRSVGSESRQLEKPKKRRKKK